MVVYLHDSTAACPRRAIQCQIYAPHEPECTTRNHSRPHSAAVVTSARAAPGFTLPRAGRSGTDRAALEPANKDPWPSTGECVPEHLGTLSRTLRSTGQKHSQTWAARRVLGILFTHRLRWAAARLTVALRWGMKEGPAVARLNSHRLIVRVRVRACYCSNLRGAPCL